MRIRNEQSVVQVAGVAIAAPGRVRRAGKIAGGFCMAALCLLAVPASAVGVPDPKLPAYLVLADGVKLHPSSHPVREWPYSEEDIPQPGSKNADILKRGHTWEFSLDLDEPHPRSSGPELWSGLKAALQKQGWAVVSESNANPFSATIRYEKNGKDAWGYLEIFSHADVRVRLVEIGKPAISFSLQPPSATPEPVAADKGDFPWLLPLPGSQAGRSSHRDGGLKLQLPHNEIQFVGTDTIVKNYHYADGLSTLAFHDAYHDALLNAGWSLPVESQGPHQGDAVLVAHYGRNGSDIWAYLHNNGDDYSIEAADAGVSDKLADELARDCHAALTGVLFDFDKATLKPESDAVLGRVLALLKQDGKLRLEIQGHTDNVGSDAYNDKLSDERAAAVAQWLTSHGVAAARLSSKGYGKRLPVASNASDEGRARNRRVEIARPDCKG